MLKAKYTRQFKKDYKKLKYSYRNIDSLDVIISKLLHEEILEPTQKDHPLHGKWKGFRECHIDGDWLLIYYKDKESITFVRTGTHSELFS